MEQYDSGFDELNTDLKNFGRNLLTKNNKIQGNEKDRRIVSRGNSIINKENRANSKTRYYGGFDTSRLPI